MPAFAGMNDGLALCSRLTPALPRAPPFPHAPRHHLRPRHRHRPRRHHRAPPQRPRHIGAILTTLAGALPPERRATLRTLRHPADRTSLDRAITLWLPGPGTYTGEDCAELHLHGGRAVLNDVADALVALGARPAEPGEFTRRAFLNGRMDLIEAEAIGDLVAAETTAQRRQALRQLEGALGAIYNDWADRLLNLMAQQEALIDFPDEDLPPETEAATEAAIQALLGEITAHLNDNRRGERLREGLVFAITGPPNVGKSSLVNALADRDVAIVSPHPRHHPRRHRNPHRAGRHPRHAGRYRRPARLITIRSRPKASAAPSPVPPTPTLSSPSRSPGGHLPPMAFT